MKNKIQKPDYWKDYQVMNAEQLANFCQKMYDDQNWRGLKPDELEKFMIAKKIYKEQTGHDVKLTYYCPP